MGRPDERLSAVEDIRMGAVEDVHGTVMDIYAGPSGAGTVSLCHEDGDRVLDLDAAGELIIYLGLAIARARDPR